MNAIHTLEANNVIPLLSVLMAERATMEKTIEELRETLAKCEFYAHFTGGEGVLSQRVERLRKRLAWIKFIAKQANS